MDAPLPLPTPISVNPVASPSVASVDIAGMESFMKFYAAYQQLQSMPTYVYHFVID